MRDRKSATGKAQIEQSGKRQTMKNILLAVDGCKNSVKIIDTMTSLFRSVLPEKLVLLYVEKIEGYSIMDELILSDSEMETLKESLQGTEYQEMLNERAGQIIAYFKNLLALKGITHVKTVVKEGHPAEEILKTADEEEIDMIVMGSRGKRLHNLFMGSVSREVSNKAGMSVLLVK